MAKSKGYTLSPEALSKVRETVRIVLGEYRNNPKNRGGPGSGRTNQMEVGKTGETIAKGDSGDVVIWRGSTKGAETAVSPELRITAYNRFGDLASGMWVYVVWLGSGWEIFQAEIDCEEA